MEDAIKDLETIQEVFDSFGVRLILVYGALLGHYRDGKFLPGDDDIDLAVIDEISYKTRKEIGFALLDLGFEPLPIAFNVYGRMERSYPGYNGDGNSGVIVCKRNFKFTIFFFGRVHCDIHDWEYLCIPMMGAMKLISTPAKFYEKLDTIKIHKKKYLVPSPIEKYLEFTYFGKSWKDKNDRRHGETYNDMHKTK